ncbi:MAG: SDR family NAD(P)-dependent oxidoreductase [Acutalibacteraceae bacterium]|nr:SDR family NAD(P)-dependent oxidoreductase [Acutalibacteraceae bacterium]
MDSIYGKTVAITGATGGIGIPLCKELLKRKASLILVDRNKEKSMALKDSLKNDFADANIINITADLSSIESVKMAVKELKKYGIDVFIHNAGAYSIPRYKSDSGYDNVFTINFVSPYYIIKELMHLLCERRGRVVVMGSIAHRYGKADFDDIDFAKRKRASLVYGNAKRYLMFSLYELFKDNQDMLSIVHPGITFTGITNHYPKLIFALIKHPMKLIFMPPRKACLCAVEGIYNSTPYGCWIGPRIFDVWGKMKLKKIKTDLAECKKIGRKAEEIYNEQTEEY